MDATVYKFCHVFYDLLYFRGLWWCQVVVEELKGPPYPFFHMRKRGVTTASFRILSPWGIFAQVFMISFPESTPSKAKTVTCENVLLKHLGNFPPPCILKGRGSTLVVNWDFTVQGVVVALKKLGGGHALIGPFFCGENWRGGQLMGI